MPERAYGPGWSNFPTWVYIANAANGQLRCECIQPEERSRELHTLYVAGEAMCAALKSAVPTEKSE